MSKPPTVNDSIWFLHVNHFKCKSLTVLNCIAIPFLKLWTISNFPLFFADAFDYLKIYIAFCLHITAYFPILTQIFSFLFAFLPEYCLNPYFWIRYFSLVLHFSSRSVPTFLFLYLIHFLVSVLSAKLWSAMTFLFIKSQGEFVNIKEAQFESISNIFFKISS